VRVFQALEENWFESAASLAARLTLDEGTVHSALGAYVQAGRVIYDLNQNVYRVRELSREPLPMEALRFANPREEEANRLVARSKIKVRAEDQAGGVLQLAGKVDDCEPKIWIDVDQRLSRGQCTCNFYGQNKLHKGPCEHMLALRMAYQNSTSQSLFHIG
jgi:predicted nucleic acid-binding Zn finger protein